MINNVLSGCLRILPILAVSLAGGLIEGNRSGWAATADLWQARNGTPTLPTSPVEWVRGNASPANSHYIEGYSIPYRMVLSGLTNGPHTLVIEWDTRLSGKHAIDYITHYDRLEPHTLFGAHSVAESINPLDGLTGPFSAPAMVPIPAPSSTNSPLAGQPAASFEALPETQRVITIWNGAITGLAYLVQEPLTNVTASTRLAIEFVSSADTVVIAWGGHIASKADWGPGNSAVNIGGSPYHMRKIELDGAGGNQDRSVQALAVSSPPSCTVTGLAEVCGAALQTYSVLTDAADASDSRVSYQWSLADNTSGATLIGQTNRATVQVATGTSGSFTLQVTVQAGYLATSCNYPVTVTPVTSISSLADQTACLRSDVTLTTVPSGAGPFSYVWRKDGQVIPGATNSVLVLNNLTSGDGGEYCAEVTGVCGSAATCATLTVIPPPTLVGPPDITRECFSDVPPPDTSTVQAGGGAPPVTVVHAGDVVQTNGCDILIFRTYQAMDACDSVTPWVQTITVRDTLAPVFASLPPRTVECGTEWSFEDPVVSDQCDGTAIELLAVSSVTNNLCGKTYSVTRTWSATDRCGNNAVASQTVTVVDSTAPVLTCLPNRTVECGTPWDFDFPTASDICDGPDVLVTVSETVTNVLGGNVFSATRTWLATDACGNATTCSQTITVRDSTPPEIVCPPKTVVPSTGPEGATVSFLVTATDTCDAGVQVVCVPASGSVFPLGDTLVECVATDINGNRSQCSFTVSVIDVVPPVITCPTNLFVLEEPPGSGQASVQFPAPTVSDNHDPNPVITFSPPSGSTLPVGDTEVLCVATDASGNTNVCSFQVRVVPRTIVATSTADSGPGTLRQALLDANAAPGSNVVTFAFPGQPPYVIHLLSPLPALVDAVIIDGWSQLEFHNEPVIELDGSNVVAAGGRIGLSIVAGGIEVRGLVLNGFEVGLHVAGPGGNVIQGNFIGVDPQGTTPPPNTGDGLVVLSPGNLIGGDTPSTRNVISGNAGNGVVFDGVNAAGNTLRGNWIGTAADGSSPAGNQNGVMIRNGAANNRIGPDNLIAFNSHNGVLLESSAGTGNAILGNAIHSNGALGIDLGGDGSTANDEGDVDSGPNRLQNTPVIGSATLVEGMTVIDGSLHSATSAVFRLEFFLNPALEGGGSAEGKKFLGSAMVTSDAAGHGTFVATLPLAVPADQFITATATDAGDNTSEFSAPAKVGGAPVIVVQPVGTAVPPGGSATFCVTAEGSQPLTYQWRLNGANILDATNVCFTVDNAQITSGGSYTVVVANEYGVVISEPAVLRLILPSVPAGDNFVDRVRLTNNTGLVSWNNLSATREPGEPNHAGKPGSRSVWYTWTAPQVGVATFSAAGSAFDTLLAVYTGQTLGTLSAVVSDEDQGGFFTSVVRFNAIAGVTYHIAIDGFGQDAGEIVLNWSFNATTRLLPVIFSLPAPQTVVAGATATFMVDASVDCREPHYNCRRVSRNDPLEPPSTRDPLLYQWYFNGVAIAGATRPVLTLSNVQESAVGTYSVMITGDGGTISTPPVRLQINDTSSTAQSVQTQDKFLDAAINPPLRLGTPSTFTPAGAGSSGDDEGTFAPAVIVRSYTSTQVFSSVGSTTSAGELPPCFGIGGASDWYAVVSEEDGTLHVDTDGSNYDTVLSVYTYGPTGGLTQLGCDNNSGIDRRDSSLNVPVQAGQTNFVVIDGYNGAYGVASLHLSLVTPGLLTPLGMTPQQAFGLRLTGRPAMRFTLQTSSNMLSWASLLTTNSVSGTFDFIDARSTNAPRRYYRAVMLP